MTDNRQAILFTDYETMEEAKTHINSLANDALKALINLDNPVHFTRLLKVSKQEGHYKAYWCVVENSKKLKLILENKYKDKIRKWIELKTNWQISSDARLKTNITLVHGRFYVELVNQKQSLKLKFDELENLL